MLILGRFAFATVYPNGAEERAVLLTRIREHASFHGRVHEPTGRERLPDEKHLDNNGNEP